MELFAPADPATWTTQVDEALAEVLEVCRGPVSSGSDGDVEAAQLLPIGSHHLGVAHPSDEVDVVYVAPLNVNMAQLPMLIRQRLERRPDVRSICPAGADGLLAGPGWRFSLRGTPLKLLLAQRIPDLPLPRSDAIVQNTSGLLAREASEKILVSVPSVDRFRQLLRFVRHWGRQRGVYGSAVGFVGGPVWAVCCARVCQMNPDAELSQLVARFFRTLGRWDWRQPVSLLPAGAASPPASPAEASDEGSPSSQEAGPAMQVLLPVGSGVHATMHLSKTAMKIMQKELRRGHKMVQQVEMGRAHWSEVFAGSRFFQRHRHYLEFDFLASSDAILAPWLAWGRQQMQGLVSLFESMSSNKATLRPWPEWIEFKDAEWPHARAVFVGLHLERGGEDKTEGARRFFDLRDPIVKFLEAVSAWPEAKTHAKQFELLVRHVRHAELEQWLDNQHRGLLVTRGGAAAASASDCGTSMASTWKKEGAPPSLAFAE